MSFRCNYKLKAKSSIELLERWFISTTTVRKSLKNTGFYHEIGFVDFCQLRSDLDTFNCRAHRIWGLRVECRTPSVPSSRVPSTCSPARDRQPGEFVARELLGEPRNSHFCHKEILFRSSVLEGLAAATLKRCFPGLREEYAVQIPLSSTPATAFVAARHFACSFGIVRPLKNLLLPKLQAGFFGLQEMVGSGVWYLALAVAQRPASRQSSQNSGWFQIISQVLRLSFHRSCTLPATIPLWFVTTSFAGLFRPQHCARYGWPRDVQSVHVC
jgi:hypothetical protein